jgi:hypothetical protein
MKPAAAIRRERGVPRSQVLVPLPLQIMDLRTRPRASGSLGSRLTIGM